jgi:hypothetical protein
MKHAEAAVLTGRGDLLDHLGHVFLLDLNAIE